MALKLTCYPRSWKVDMDSHYLKSWLEFKVDVSLTSYIQLDISALSPNHQNVYYSFPLKWGGSCFMESGIGV